MTEIDQTDSKKTSIDSDEIDIKELVGIFWEGKKIILFLSTLVAISAITFSLLLTNHYRSESILIFKDSKSSGSLSQISGLASLAGIGIPNTGNQSMTEVMEIIKSRNFVRHLLTFEEILPSLMAAKSYNISTKELLFDSEIYDAESKVWKREVSPNKPSEPTYLEVHKKYLTEILTVNEDSVTGVVSIRVEHISPIFAKEFLELIIREANDIKRQKDIETSNKALIFLKQELSRTPLLEIKESINQLIENQLETQMMAKVNEEYVLAVIEPPFIPEKKSKPNRSLIVVLTTAFGGMLSLLIVLVRHYFKKGSRVK